MSASKKKWQVSLPITGVVIVYVEAATEEEAIDAAFDKGASSEDIEEWQTHRKIVEGNIFHGEMNSASAEELS